MSKRKKQEPQEMKRLKFSDGRNARIVRTTDPDGRIVEQAQMIDRYERLAKQGRITENEATSARKFHRLFVIANLSDTGSTPLVRVGGGSAGRGGLTESQNQARILINDIFKSMGGQTSMLSSILWHVVGLEDSIEKWVEVQAWSGRSVNPHNASGVLCAAISALDEYFYQHRRKFSKRKGEAS